MAKKKDKIKNTHSHPAKRFKKKDRKWSWQDAADTLNVSVLWLRLNYHQLPEKLQKKLEVYLGN